MLDAYNCVELGWTEPDVQRSDRQKSAFACTQFSAEQGTEAFR